MEKAKLNLFAVLIFCVLSISGWAEPAVCPSGSALNFDGVDDYVRAASPTNFSNTTFTVSAWFKTTGENGVLLGQDGFWEGWLISAHKEIALLFKNNSYDAYLAKVKGGNHADNNWHHIVMVVTTNTVSAQGNHADIYVDGVKADVDETYTNRFSPSNSNLYFGLRAGSKPYPFKGTIDDTAIYNRALSEDEIQTLTYSKGSDISDGLIGYWGFDEGQGQVARDLSVNDNDGLLGGSNETQNSDPSWVEPGAPVAPPALVKLEIVGPGQALEDSTVQYKVIAYYDNGGTKDVTSSAEWAVEPDNYVFIDSNGMLYTDILKKPTEKVTVYVQYAECEITAEAEKAVTIRALCPAGSGLDFDGVDDYVNLGDLDVIAGSNPFTITAWVNPELLSGSGREILAKGSGTNTYQHQIVLRISVDGKLQGVFSNGSVMGNVITGESTIPLNTWSYLVFSWDGTTDPEGMKLYVNGVLDKTRQSTSATIQNLNYPAYIGAYSNKGARSNFFNGKIDELQIWSKALSEEDIQAKMYLRLTGAEADLAGFWDFDEGQGQVVHDLSVNGNDGILGGSDETQNSDPIWVEPGAPIDFCTVPQMIDRNLTEALELKKEVLEIVQQALESEKASMEMLEELFRTGDYIDFKKNDIVKAKQGIFSAMQHEVQGAGAVNKSIDKLEESSDILGLDLDEE